MLKDRHNLIKYWDGQIKHYRKKLRGNLPDKYVTEYEGYLDEAIQKRDHFRHYYRKREREVGKFTSGDGNYGGHFKHD
jgi:hypothetical protein